MLPRNGEWEYAREFIMMSEMLDDERKEAFLQALHGLREEQEQAAEHERELVRQQKEQLEQQHLRDEEERLAEEQRAEEDRRREEARRKPQRPPDSTVSNSPPSARSRAAAANSSPQSNTTSRSARQPPKKDLTRRSQPPRPPAASMIARATAMFTALRTLLLDTAQGLASNPLALLRTLLFILALMLALGRRDLRERVRRLLRQMWDKLRATVGMGVKVSYI